MDFKILSIHFWKICLVIFIICIQESWSLNDECDTIIESEGGYISWETDPAGENCIFRRWKVTMNKKGGIQIKVNSVSLDNHDGSFFLLGPGLEPDNFLQDTNVPIVINNKNTLNYIILEQNKFSILLRTTKGYGRFYLVYDSYYEPGPPTTSTTTKKPPLENSLDSALLYVNRTTLTYLQQNTYLYEVQLTEIANRYVSAHKIKLQRELTSQDIGVWDIGPCTPGWPYWHQCVKTNVSILWFDKNQVLEAWQEFGNLVLNESNMSVYLIPDYTDYYWLWVGISAGIVLLLVLLVGICQRTRILYCLQIKQNTKKGHSLISTRSSNSSQGSWFPTLTRERVYSEDRRSISNGHQWITADLQVPNDDTLDSIQDNKNNYSSNSTFGAGTIFFQPIHDPVYDLPDENEDEKDV